MTLWLFGDSIFAGAAFEVKVKPRHPAWPVRAPGPMIELMLDEPCTRPGGPTAIPSGVEEAASGIEAMVGRDIGPGDVIVMLDVGVHSFDPDVHERQWLQLRAATRAHPGLTLICEGFDFGAQGRRRKVHSKPIRGGRSANDAVRAAALEPMRQAGRTVFVPTSKPLLRYHHALAELYGLGAGWNDGIHLNVWGQGRLCWLVLEALGRTQPEAMARWRSFAEAHWSILQAPGPAAAGRIAEMACAPSDSLYGGERAATARGAAS